MSDDEQDGVTRQRTSSLTASLMSPGGGLMPSPALLAALQQQGQDGDANVFRQQPAGAAFSADPVAVELQPGLRQRPTGPPPATPREIGSSTSNMSIPRVSSSGSIADVPEMPARSYHPRSGAANIPRLGHSNQKGSSRRLPGARTAGGGSFGLSRSVGTSLAMGSSPSPYGGGGHWLNDSEFGVSVAEQELQDAAQLGALAQPIFSLNRSLDEETASVSSVGGGDDSKDPSGSGQFQRDVHEASPLLALTGNDDKNFDTVSHSAMSHQVGADVPTLAGIASPSYDPQNRVVTWPIFRWCLRLCGMNPFLKIYTIRHIALKLLVAAAVSCMVPWLWIPQVRLKNWVSLETTFEWVAAVWMVLYGFEYWRHYETLARLLDAIETDSVAVARIAQLANRYQSLLVLMIFGCLGFFLFAEFNIEQPLIRKNSEESLIEYLFAAIGVPAFTLVFCTVSVFYLFICHLHLLHVRLCRHMMGENIRLSEQEAIASTRTQFALCRDLTKQSAKQFERLLLPFMICLSVDLITDVVFVAQNATLLSKGLANTVQSKEVQRMTLFVDAFSITGELVALVVFLLAPALISKAWLCTMLRANELHLHMSGMHSHEAAMDEDFQDYHQHHHHHEPEHGEKHHHHHDSGAESNMQSLETIASKRWETGSDHSIRSTGLHHDSHEFLGLMAVWLHRMNFHWKYLDVQITTNFVSSIVYALVSVAVITLRVVNTETGVPASTNSSHPPGPG